MEYNPCSNHHPRKLHSNLNVDLPGSAPRSLNHARNSARKISALEKRSSAFIYVGSASPSSINGSTSPSIDPTEPSDIAFDHPLMEAVIKCPASKRHSGISDYTLDWLGTDYDQTCFPEDYAFRTASTPSTPCSFTIIYPTISSSPDSALNPLDRRLLEYYEDHVSLVPWTNPSNPMNSLRSIMPLIFQSQSLLNAVMALSAAHRQVDLPARLAYKSKALSSFSEILGDADCDSRLDELLAIVLVLLTLQSVENGRGSWRMHLRGARQILNRRLSDRNVVEELRENTTLRSIVLQICWYDTVWALLSLCPHEIPDLYRSAAIAVNLDRLEGSSHGGMSDTVGCPERLYLLMSHIVNGEITSLEDVHQHQLTDVKIFLQNGISADDAIDMMHVENVWKYAAIIYLLTTQRSHVKEKQMMGICTRLVMDHAQCLASSISQKQLLVALVITGAQVDNATKRNTFVCYCEHWQRLIKHAVYESGLHILRETWTLRDQQSANGEEPTACWVDVTAGADYYQQYMLG